MSLARFFSKPRWLSKDATVRRDAVATEKAAELVSQLARFAREDDDAGVRITALKRLAEPGLAQAMAQDDRDEGVRNAARTLFTELLAGTHASAPALADRLRLLRAQDDARLIEQIAVTAPEPELRLAALQRVERPALILERVTADSDAAVRLAALDRIDDETQLHASANVRARPTRPSAALRPNACTPCASDAVTPLRSRSAPASFASNSNACCAKATARIRPR
ncbi:MAG: hypothetical protein IPP82_15160 [Xanthomonadales bacterium]|nr:hypothetical protein [Xanthomonadales bacterium]